MDFLAHHDPADLIHYPEDGDYLIDGEPSRRFDALKQKLGNSLTLMSGYRGHSKRMLFFSDKVVASDGNLSLALRNRAPPVIPSTSQAISILVIGDLGTQISLGNSLNRRFIKQPFNLMNGPSDTRIIMF